MKYFFWLLKKILLLKYASLFFVVSIAWFYSTNCVLQIPETANTNLHMSIYQLVVRLVLNMRKY